MQIPERCREFTHPARGRRRTGRQEWRWRSTTDATRDAMCRGRSRSSTMARARRTVTAPGGAQAGEPDGSDEAGGGHVRPMPRPAPRRTGPMRNTASWTSTEPPLADARWRNRRHKGSPRMSRETRMGAGEPALRVVRGLDAGRCSHDSAVTLDRCRPSPGSSAGASSGTRARQSRQVGEMRAGRGVARRRVALLGRRQARCIGGGCATMGLVRLAMMLDPAASSRGPDRAACLRWPPVLGGKHGAAWFRDLRSQCSCRPRPAIICSACRLRSGNCLEDADGGWSRNALNPSGADHCVASMGGKT